MKLEQWAVVALPEPYQAPELWKSRLQGNAYGRPGFGDGDKVVTSNIVGKRNGKIVTESGSEYELGEVYAPYERQYPDALNRLMNSLDEV